MLCIFLVNRMCIPLGVLLKPVNHFVPSWPFWSSFCSDISQARSLSFNNSFSVPAHSHKHPTESSYFPAFLVISENVMRVHLSTTTLSVKAKYQELLFHVTGWLSFEFFTTNFANQTYFMYSLTKCEIW